MPAAHVFQNRLLEFLLSEPVAISDDRSGAVEWESVGRCALLARVLLMANGAHPDNRRRVREHMLVLRVSWTTSLARHQLLVLRSVAVDYFPDPNHVPSPILDALPMIPAIDRGADIGAVVDEYRFGSGLRIRTTPYAAWYEYAIAAQHRGAEYDPDEEARLRLLARDNFWWD
jgi:hypothetical protein